MFAFQSLLGTIQSFVAESVFQTDTSHRTPALALDEDFAFLVLIATYLVSEEIIGTEEPFSIPTMLLYGFVHRIHRLLHALGFCEIIFLGKSCYCALMTVCCFLGELLAESNVVLACYNKQTCNHQTLCLAAFTLILCSLETLVWIPGEAVEVETVVPVSSSDEWQLVRTEIIDDVIHRNLQMFEETYLATRLVVERYLL